MKFRSNNCVAIYLPDLKKAEAFYTGVMGFRLASKDPTQLEYDTGRFSLCIHKSAAAKPPVPSFTVISIEAARSHLEANHCSVVQDPDGSFHFKDPFGVTYHLVED
jgi:catechol 2,3-dioxygenase-like lactoylglutathione lyase family enzyme